VFGDYSRSAPTYSGEFGCHTADKARLYQLDGRGRGLEYLIERLVFGALEIVIECQNYIGGPPDVLGVLDDDTIGQSGRTSWSGGLAPRPRLGGWYED